MEKANGADSALSGPDWGLNGGHEAYAEPGGFAAISRWSRPPQADDTTG
jgi:hypothetical protein